MAARSTCKCIHGTSSPPAGTRKEEQWEILPGSSRAAGAPHSPLCKAATHRVNGNEWRSDAPSFPWDKSSGIGVRGLTGSAQPSPGGAASGSSQKAWPLHLLPLCPRRTLESVVPTYKGPAAGAALGSWQGCRDLPTGAHTAGVPVTWEATGRLVQGSPKTSKAGSQACLPQGSTGVAWCPRPSDCDLNSARTRTLRST